MFFPTTLLVLVASLVSSLPTLAAPVESSVEARDSSWDGESYDYNYGQATWFEVGLGACGNWDTNADYIVAMNSPQYGQFGYGGYCERFVEVTNTENGKSAVAKVRDECPSCGWGSLDMSPDLFNALASGGLDQGVFPIKWDFYYDGWQPAGY